MAKNRKNQNTSNDVFENPDALADRLTKTEQFLERNRVMVFSIGGVIALIVAGIFVYKYFVGNANQEAQQAMFQAVYYFESDSLDQALNGDGNNLGFLDIAEEYSLTDAANLSNYYIGASYLKKGNYESAIEYFNEFNAGDILVKARALSLTGDAYAQLGEYSKAADFYKKAADHKPNEYFTPIYLEKAALAFEEINDYEAAAQCYQAIVDDFYGASGYQNARKQLHRLQSLSAS